MTKDDIICMAQDAGAELAELPRGDAWLFTNDECLERFAALVASAERERIKQANAPEIERINAHIKELEDAVKAERSACIKIVEDEAMQYAEPVWAFEIVNDIKARGQNNG